MNDKLDHLIKATQNMYAEIREYISSVRTSMITERDSFLMYEDQMLVSIEDDGRGFDLFGLLDWPEGKWLCISILPVAK